jgi:hypothetical protein
MIAALPTEDEYFPIYRRLIERYDANDPKDVDMHGPNAAAHITRMREIIAAADAP